MKEMPKLVQTYKRYAGEPEWSELHAILEKL